MGGVLAALAPRFWGAHLLALVLVAAAGALGVWQFESWQGHREAKATDLSTLTPMTLDEVFGSDDPFPGDKVGQPTVVSGAWVPGSTVYVEGRAHAGEPGYWVVTFLGISGPDDPALPVVRGWIADHTTAPAAPQGPAELLVWLQPTEGTNQVDQDRSDDVIPQVRTADLIQHVDQDLYAGFGIVVDPAEAPPGDWPVGSRASNAGSEGLEFADLTQLPQVSATTGLKNLLYAIQWWVFGAFALFIWWRYLLDALALRRAEDAAEVGSSPEPNRDPVGSGS